MSEWSAIAALALALGAGAGCDRLVGGTCARDYAEVDGACLAVGAIEADAGVGGIGGDGAGGTGGSAGGTGGNAGGTASCQSPLASCGGTCVNLADDPNHCGACDVACATSVCVAGACTGDVVGHAVVVGTDFQQVSLGSPAAVLLGNAVFMSPHEPVRLAEYRKYASAAAVARVGAILEHEAAARGRSFVLEPVGDAKALAACVDQDGCDSLLFHHQAFLPLGAEAVLASGWSSAIGGLFESGGTAIVLAGASGSAAAMADFVNDFGLLDTTGVAVEGNGLVYNEGWLDVLGQGVMSPFLAPAGTVSFLTDEAAGPMLSFVLKGPSGRPVAIHRAFP